MTALSAHDRRIIARARKLAEAGASLDALREHTGQADTAAGYARAFGEARHLLGELAAIIERPAADAGDAQRLNEIRALLAAFDWEHHDRQLALEAIERIVEGGQP